MTKNQAMEAGIMSTGAPLDLDLPKELVGMEYWTSLFVQVRDCPDDSFLFLSDPSPIIGNACQ